MIFNMSETNSGGGGTNMVTITITQMYLNADYIFIPPTATLETDPDEPWISHLTIPENDLFVFVCSLQATNLGTNLTYTSKVSGRNVYCYSFYTGSSDGYVSM